MTLNLNIRFLRESDIADVLKISDECRLESWTLEGYQEEFRRTDSIQLVAEAGKSKLGFIVMRLIKTDNNIELLNLAVRKKHQKRGIGKQLLETAIQKAKPKEILLEVRESNSQAIDFYKKFGFVVAGERNNFYSNPVEKALLMKMKVENDKSKV